MEELIEVLKTGFSLIGASLITLIFVLLIEVSILNKTLYEIKDKLKGKEDSNDSKQNRNKK